MGKKVQEKKKRKINSIFMIFNIMYWVFFLINLKTIFSDNSREEICKYIDTPTWYSVKTLDGDVCMLTQEFYLLVAFSVFIWILFILFFKLFKKIQF